MKQCIYCGKKIENDEPICPHCGKNMNSNNFTSNDIHTIRQNAYGMVTKNDNERNGGLTFLVIGGILLVVAIVFFVLSFRFNTAKQRVFTPISVEFVVSILCGVASLTLIIWGSIRLVLAVKKLRFYKSVIKEFDKR